MASICLAMIVKNEAHIIKECLESVKPYIDSWVICDTGSTDNTCEVIRETLADLPGELHQDEWEGFGPNRTKSILRANSKADYILVCDADFLFHVTDKKFKESLTAEAYAIKVEAYHLHFLLRSDLAWRFESFVHEYPVCDREFSWEHLQGAYYSHTLLGGNRHDKTERERALLERDLESGHNVPRTLFYLGQNYQDAGEYEEAVQYYFSCFQSSNIPQERYVALVRVAQMTDSPLDWFRALMFRPKRHDAYIGLAHVLNNNKHYQMAYDFAKTGMNLPDSGDIVFNDWASQKWRFLDELIISCFYLGKQEEGYGYCKLIALMQVPEKHKSRVQTNINFYQSGLRLK